jgi:hypothetical protein
MPTDAKRAPESVPGLASTITDPHQALGYKTSMSVWRLGTTSAPEAKAVDVTLRLDNACALHTCPQPQE